MLLRLILLSLLATPVAAQPVVTAHNIGYVTQCAEMDNVVVSLTAQDVRGFSLVAKHPGYLTDKQDDIMKADFTNCVFPKEQIYEYEPFTTVLFQNDQFKLVGHRLAKDWQPHLVDFVVGDQVVNGLHLTQLSAKIEDRWVEILVLYPSDGYWRPKPLPPVGRLHTGYGSSLMFGPISRHTRPYVAFKRIRFDPATLSYHLDFTDGNAATLRIVSVDRAALSLDIAFDRPVDQGPFVIFSSMHVTPDNADVARVTVQQDGGAKVIPIDSLTELDSTVFDFGRDVPSRHNTSAPDIVFGPFR